MAVLSLRHLKALVLAGASQLPLATAQTVVSDNGVVLAASPITVVPAAELVNVPSLVGPVEPAFATQLTDAVLANLTAHALTGVELFRFGDGPARGKRVRRDGTGPVCKTFPGDSDYPSRPIWAIFDLLTGGALIKTVPIGAVCYPNHDAFNPEKCQALIAGWATSEIHAADPTSIMSPVFSGDTCVPHYGNTTGAACTQGGFPNYAVNVSTVAQVQLAVNFARNTGLRLVVKNTGHDFLGKSTGAGALAIWTHNLKSVSYIPEFRSAFYTGPALKLGAGVQVGELFAAADRYNVTATGGECKGVGVSGGYIAGGGHSPLSPKYGLGSDSVLSADIVLPNGRFATVTEASDPDLFWALRGGGGATFGVVTSVTVKVYPRMTFSGATFTVVSGPDTPVNDTVFWNAMYAYWRQHPQLAEKGSYAYSQIFPRGPPGSGYQWTMLPWLMPGMALSDFKAMLAPLLSQWADLGLVVKPDYFEYDNFLQVWTSHFPTETVANSNLRVGSRLFPKQNWSNSTTMEAMLDAVKSVILEGSALIQYTMNPAQPPNTAPSAANSHWRDAVWFTIIGTTWGPGPGSPPVAVDESANRKLTENWMARLKPFAPGAYGNEADVMEKDFGAAFWGANYPRLLQIKRRVDPEDVFWAPTAVGSERWKVQGQPAWLPLQTGKLCRV